MRLDGTYRATVDRIEEGQAVLLVESDGETVAERHCPATELPDGADEGSVCELTFEDDELVDLAVRPEETSDRRRRMREKFDSLSRRLDDEPDEEDGSAGGASDVAGSSDDGGDAGDEEADDGGSDDDPAAGPAGDRSEGR